MPTYHHFMPLDRTKIKTRLRIHPDVLLTIYRKQPSTATDWIAETARNKRFEAYR